MLSGDESFRQSRQSESSSPDGSFHGRRLRADCLPKDSGQLYSIFDIQVYNPLPSYTQLDQNSDGPRVSRILGIDIVRYCLAGLPPVPR